MKNLKNMVSAASLMAVMIFGAVSANAGLLESDETANPTKVQCTVEREGYRRNLAEFVNELTGITIFDVTTPVCREISSERARWS